MTEFARNLLREISKSVGEEPHGNMDQSVAERCDALSIDEKLNADDVKKLLDECHKKSLCSTYTKMVLHVIWDDLKPKNDNTTKQTANKLGPKTNHKS